MKPLLASLLFLAACAFGAEDITLSDGRTFTDASIGALDKDRCVIISGNGYAARVKLSLLPQSIQERVDPGSTAKLADDEQLPEIMAGKPEVTIISSDPNEIIYAWKIRVTNTTAKPRRLKLTFSMLDECEFEVASGVPKEETIGKFREEIFSGNASVRPAVARKASMKRVKVEW